ncbi:MAG TPA: phosphotransferase [Nocardioidaceae bacterium]|nr:phosphotransferase [Nocardioidaceae bacterium]
MSQDADPVGSGPTAAGMASLTPLAGGYSGETFLVADGRTVVRIYAREPQRAVVDAALLRLVRGLVPVPAVLEVRPADAGRPGVLLTERLPGVRLEELLPRAGAAEWERLGIQLGRLLARLSGIPMPRPGTFADAELRIDRAELPDDLRDWVRGFRDNGRLAAWPAADHAALLRLADDAADRWPQPPCDRRSDPAPGHHPEQARCVLVHSDFNPKNILVDPATLAVVGLLDWEFAHAGSPYTDLGNLLRFERRPEFVAAVVAEFVDRAPPLAPDPLLEARYADLWALVELAGGGRPNAVRELAAELLRAQARAGDPTAWPWDTERATPKRAG